MSYGIKFSDLKGKVLADVKVEGDENITFITTEGERFDMYHDQDCCEHVSVESIVGDLKDLLGHPLLMAEESTNSDNPPEHADSYTWTFYKLATIKGYVDIRWLGQSNGYYSESVSLHKGPDLNSEEVLALLIKNNLKVQSVLQNTDNEINEENKEIYKKKKSRFNI